MKKVIICGLGAVGTTFASKFLNSKRCELKILADKGRIEKYMKFPPELNGKKLEFEYVFPEQKGYNADLIIICTKYQGLKSALSYIKNFVTGNTRVLSLINGISSEEIIKSKYPQAKVLKSYFIGHSAVREGNSVTQDGVGKIVCENDSAVEEIFTDSGIDYEFPSDIDYNMWLKFTLNLFSNQTSAILKMTFGEMKNNKNFISFAKKIINEVYLIAKKSGLKNLKLLEADALKALGMMCDEGKTSMLQDIISGRPTEVDIFAGEVIRLGKLYGVQTPYNQVLYDLIKIEEERVCK
ncbi:ketopantoate reductase family protein [bacterium]|nr:ketopantoate reductase family protein [bacterium]